MHQSSYDKMLDFKNRFLNSRIGTSQVILDLGSQDINGTYKNIFSEPGWKYSGLDMEPGENVDVVLKDPYSWKEISSNSADVVISGQAIEHVEYFWVTMLEIARVLKPGGLCCIIAPSGGPEHRFPVDCWRFYCDGFKALSKFALLQEIETYQQKEPNDNYTDSSNLWLDSVLICKKGNHAWALRLRHQIWRFMVHRLCLKGI